MPAYDWLVCGAGVTGSALSYELQKAGFRVLLLERHRSLQGASRFSYGGIPYWSGTTPLTQTLCQEAIDRYPQLGAELDYPIGFREIDLLLTLNKEEEVNQTLALYQNCLHAPRYLDMGSVQEREPLLSGEYLQGALWCNHAQIDPEALCEGYRQAFLRSGGEVRYGEVVGLSGSSTKITGVVTTSAEEITSESVALCAGGLGRQLLQTREIAIPLFFTHTELIEILPQDRSLRSIILPANLKRLQFEASGSKKLWQDNDQGTLPASLDAGAAPLPDGRVRLGQISRLHPDPHYKISAQESETTLRSALAKILPDLAWLPGTWHHCLAAFTQDALPLIGKMHPIEGLHLFTGFTSPMVFVPPLARRFAQFLLGHGDDFMAQLAPDRGLTI